MCCCAKPTVNGEPGYSWDGKTVSVCPVDPPAIAADDKLLFDEPGRCGGLDSHCYHYRVVKNCGLKLLVRHGGGELRVRLSGPLEGPLSALDSNARYWVLNAIYHAQNNAKSDAQISAGQVYRKAFAEGRLKKRKIRGTDSYKVWIE